MDIKDHWIIPHVDRVTIIDPPKFYPIHLTLNDHPFIDEIEISMENYIMVKYRGKWIELYLPIDGS